MVGLSRMDKKGRDPRTGIRCCQFSRDNPALAHAGKNQLTRHPIDQFYGTLVVIAVLPRHVQQRLGLSLYALYDSLINVHGFELILL